MLFSISNDEIILLEFASNRDLDECKKEEQILSRFIWLLLMFISCRFWSHTYSEIIERNNTIRNETKQSKTNECIE